MYDRIPKLLSCVLQYSVYLPDGRLIKSHYPLQYRCHTMLATPVPIPALVLKMLLNSAVRERQRNRGGEREGESYSTQLV